jgi:hypothetical protein
MQHNIALQAIAVETLSLELSRAQAALAAEKEQNRRLAGANEELSTQLADSAWTATRVGGRQQAQTGCQGMEWAGKEALPPVNKEEPQWTLCATMTAPPATHSASHICSQELPPSDLP